MNNRLWLAGLLAGFVLLTDFSSSLRGQATDSNIVGIVADVTGAAVPNAEIVATNQETAVAYKTVSNGTGEYRLNNVPVGTYTIGATARGFAPASVSGVRLELNRTASINLTLSVAGTATTIEVSEAPAALDSNTSQLQTTLAPIRLATCRRPDSQKQSTAPASITVQPGIRRSLGGRI